MKSMEIIQFGKGGVGLFVCLTSFLLRINDINHEDDQARYFNSTLHKSDEPRH